VNEVIWEPTPEVVARANVTRLMRREGIGSYGELVRRSQEEPEWFWPAAVADMGLQFSTPWERVLDDSRGPEWTRWFVGGKLNLAWNCVHRWAAGERADAVAAIWHGEDGTRAICTYRELSDEVTSLAAALVRLGVEPGDRVAAYMPMSPQAAVGLYACAHIGAILVPVFSGFGASALAARLAASGAKVVLTADGMLRRGREIRVKETVDEALSAARSVEHVIVWQRLGRVGTPMTEGRDLAWEAALAEADPSLPHREVESEHPFLVIYTSGTTGAPKGVVHVQGGFLVSVARELCYHADAHPEDVVHYVSDFGWIMGPWAAVGSHALGAAVVFAEGAPDYPAPDRLWRLVDADRATILGVSPTLVRSLIPHGTELVSRHDLSSLRVIVAAGEPWNPDPYRWLFRHVGGGRCPIINCSGGTEVAACFLAPSVVTPIKTCSLGGPVLGMSVDVVDERGRPVRGDVGELVCRRPFPGMTRGFWQGRERYLETYWRRLPGVWVHGDWASIDDDGYWYLHGRSDDTLNVAGKRIGPAEMESAAVAHEAVMEAAAIGAPDPVKGEVPWLFCVPAPGAAASTQLAEAVAALVSERLGKPFRPARVLFVSSLPKTRTAKILRRVIRAVAVGSDPGDLSALDNPEALAEIEALAGGSAYAATGRRTGG
jgi:acetyl-CoA synthetase